MSKTWNYRPSEILNIEQPYIAYCIDNAVATFGRSLEAELNKVEGKTDKQRDAKRQRILAIWLDEPVKYRDPPATRLGKAKDVVESFSAVGVDVPQY